MMLKLIYGKLHILIDPLGNRNHAAHAWQIASGGSATDEHTLRASVAFCMSAGSGFDRCIARCLSSAIPSDITCTLAAG